MKCLTRPVQGAVERGSGCRAADSARGARNRAAPRRRATSAGAVALAIALLGIACARGVRERPEPLMPGARTAVVTATAYNSHPDQTDGDPFLTASGERLVPGMRALAVSRDLVDAGLAFGTRVRIEGMEGEWVVLDRMPAGHRRSIDLYFGLDEQAALRFGRKRVRIDWSH